MKKSLIIFCAIALAACNAKMTVDGQNIGEQKPQETPYRNETASGLIGGTPWTFVSGTAKPVYDDPQRIEIVLNNEAFADPCSGLNFGKVSVMTRTSVKPGETIFGEGNPMQSATFFYQNDQGGINMFVFDGKVKIEAITDTEVVGSFLGKYDSQNYVNGSFKLIRCAR
ncbi:MAG: hypothetical protein IPM97_07840 [Bdellovibrionaceae bacterium]|nr:hypothetical protein [Pseudobdellovibrionaceae bacterium]